MSRLRRLLGQRDVDRGVGSAVTLLGTVLATALTVHTAWNAVRMRRAPTHPPPVTEPVTVVVPARDEAHRIGSTVASVLAQQAVPDLELVVVDDASTDATVDVVRSCAGDDPRCRVQAAPALPPGWLGKPHACAAGAATAGGSILVFVDADVVLQPHALAATVSMLRQLGLDLVSPYPRQLADGLGPRLVQPLLQWSWLTFLPLRVAERSTRPSLSAANGQLLAVDAATYHRAGGHASVRDSVLDDVDLLRAIKRAGGRGVVVDGSTLATCRMYEGWAQVRDGYSKSLWSAFGSPAGAVGAAGLLTVTYLVPPAAALTGSRVGAVGTAAAVLGRVVVARATGQRVWPDVVAHPASVATAVLLLGRSWWLQRRGALAWKGRALAP